MSKAFGLILIVIAMYLGMTIYTEGIDNAFGGVLAGVERDEPLASDLTPAEQHVDGIGSAAPPRNRMDAIRQRVTADLDTSARRRGYE